MSSLTCLSFELLVPVPVVFPDSVADALLRAINSSSIAIILLKHLLGDNGDEYLVLVAVGGDRLHGPWFGSL